MGIFLLVQDCLYNTVDGRLEEQRNVRSILSDQTPYIVEVKEKDEPQELQLSKPDVICLVVVSC